MSKKKFEIRKQRILPGFDSGHYEPRRHYDRADFSTPLHDEMRRDNRVNVRISGTDLTTIKKIALDKGIPPQTLLANIIHRYACGELTEIPIEESLKEQLRCASREQDSHLPLIPVPGTPDKSE